jgi:hypothetical protein
MCDREAVDPQFQKMMKDLERYIQLWNESRKAQAAAAANG